VFLLAKPPVQFPKLALAGDTVTERMVGTVLSDRLTLAAFPAFCSAAPLLPHPATPTATANVPTTAIASDVTLRPTAASLPDAGRHT
jgi:hypothetical protein